MRRNLLLLPALIFISAISFGQEKKVSDEGYIVKVGDAAPDFTVREFFRARFKMTVANCLLYSIQYKN